VTSRSPAEARTTATGSLGTGTAAAEPELGRRVRSFYQGCSFPDYDPDDSPSSLMAKAARSGFAAWLSEQMSFGESVRVLDVGCGTGQLPIFLSLHNRTVVGADFTFESLRKGESFARQHRLTNVSFVQMDLFNPTLQEASFDYVISMGVLHHTGDPRGGFESIARLVRPGGYIVVGLYNRIARLPTDLRRLIGRIGGERAVALVDPIARTKMRDPQRRRAWLQDQYFHPHESKHTVDEVLAWFERSGLDFVSAMPPISAGVPTPAPLFRPQGSGSRASRLWRQFTWMFRHGHEGGLFVMIGRRPTP
jgi:SAM-dependent methyltransferase